jgi:hypothetical protein
MDAHANLVTYPWLIGTGITMLGIFIILMLAMFSSKADKGLCEERHKNLDTTVKEIKEVASNANIKLDEIKEAIVRIETILNGKDRG